MNAESAPAAARREGSAAHPVSVLVPDSWSAKEGAKGRIKKRNRLFRHIRWGWGGLRHRNGMISRAEWTSCRFGPVTSYGKEAKARGTGSLFYSRAGPPSPRGQRAVALERSLHDDLPGTRRLGNAASWLSSATPGSSSTMPACASGPSSPAGRWARTASAKAGAPAGRHPRLPSPASTHAPGSPASSQRRHMVLTC